MKTLEGNKLIAEFIGTTEVSGGLIFNTQFTKEIKGNKRYGADFEEMKFHLSWDWLMPVVEKIEEILLTEDELSIDVRIEGGDCMILTWDHDVIVHTQSNNKLKAVWMGVVEFIQWYNENK